MKKDIDDYEKQFPNYVKPDYDISFFSSNINDLTKDLKKLGILFYVLKWDKESLYAGHKSIIEEIENLITEIRDAWEEMLKKYASEKESTLILEPVA